MTSDLPVICCATLVGGFFGHQTFDEVTVDDRFTMVPWTILVAAIAAVVVAAEVPSTDETTGYSAEDNWSWAVTSQKLKEPFMQMMYDGFMEGCRQESIKLNYDPVRYCDDDGMCHFDAP
jgi:hypothetical protein